MKTLRELIDEAEHALDTYKHPDVSEVQERLHEILMAGDLGGIIHDQLVHLSEYHGMLHIGTRYSVRSCEQTGEFEIPMSVIDAPDPIAAIKRWSAARKVEKAFRRVTSAKNDLQSAEAELAKARTAFEALGPE